MEGPSSKVTGWGQNYGAAGPPIGDPWTQLIRRLDEGDKKHRADGSQTQQMHLTSVFVLCHMGQERPVL